MTWIKCNSVLLRSSRTVLWTTTLHLILYHQEEERRTGFTFLVEPLVHEAMHSFSCFVTR